jgi:predicted alpha/beta-hydrolase family hydrolase
MAIEAMTEFIFDGPARARHTILLAHGAGGPMDSASMNAAARALANVGFRIARFEFAYMAYRRISHGRKPPPRAETLRSEYIAAIDALTPMGPLIIGGKSMGGRVASMIADEFHASDLIAGLVCLGYPFHPIGKPDQLRTAHLLGLRTPTLIFQGTRDAFGTPEEVATYQLSSAIEIIWLEDGNHDLEPRKGVSGMTAGDHLLTMANRVAAWARGLAASERR